MKFSSQSLKKLIKCACYFEEEKGYLYSYRFSKAQIDRFHRPDGDSFWALRTVFSGGIRIELDTEATELSFDYKCDSYSSEQNSIDLYIDGVLSDVYMIPENGKRTVSYTLPLGKKRVAVYLPIDVRIGIKNFTVNAGYKSVKDKGAKVLLIGDSISQGYGPTMASCSYVNALMRKTGLYVLNQGIGGYRYEPQDLMTVDGFEPEKIIVALGTNYYEYFGKGLEYDYEKAVKEFYARLIEIFGRDIPILNITPLWRNNDVDFELFGKCIDSIKAECQKYGNITVVDGFTLIPNVDECFCDRIHPNAYGCELMASNLAKIMKDIKF